MGAYMGGEGIPLILSGPSSLEFSASISQLRWVLSLSLTHYFSWKSTTTTTTTTCVCGQWIDIDLPCELADPTFFVPKSERPTDFF